MLNKFVANGRVVKDPELRYTTNAVPYCYFHIAIPRNYKNLDGTHKSDFVRCRAYRVTAETFCKYCHKGDLIGIEGRLEVNLQETENGSLWTTDILVENIDLLKKVK